MPGWDVCPACLCTTREAGGKLKRSPRAPSPQTWDNGEGAILKSSGDGPWGREGAGLCGRIAAVGPSLFSAALLSVLFRPSARPRPSRSAGTFPLAWPGMNQPRCASRRRHVTTAGGRAGAAVLTRRLYLLRRQPRGPVHHQGQKEPVFIAAPSIPPGASMKKAEMGRFNISPDEDSSSYSSNSDFNYSYPTKQAALKRWEKLCCLFFFF